MTSLGLTLVVQLALAAGGETYAEAHKETTQTGRPLVVLVGADWCPACKVMKNTVMPQLRQRGVLRKVAYAVVNLDREQELGAKLTENGPIPQLLVFRRTGASWHVDRLVGSQEASAVERLINDAVQASAAAPEKAKADGHLAQAQ